ncbi:hypothetical protein [Pseudomonas syringae]|uniref:hypothetical protein n=1 Tax=Pseudomonas syringae TaxID=317 RepID=UPI00128FFD03|nr:hypothetical protein [Pseudomonas syringae]MCH5519027.1 hypothetical protein [Pseudomonas syringae pv. lapsa]
MDSYKITEGHKYIPIMFMDDSACISDKPPGRPVVKVAMHFDDNHHVNPKGTENLTVYALLDTGAEHNYATPEFIAVSACPQLGTSLIHGATSSAPGTHHRCHLFFPEALVQLETDVFSAALRNSTATENLIVGMAAISMGRLVMDFKQHIYRLYWA